jgi:hypothetical protein
MVIQRWQSLFLLLAGGLMAAFTFCTLGTFHPDGALLEFKTWGIYDTGLYGSGNHGSVSTLYLAALSCLSFILPLVGIFLFRNLTLQRRVCSVSALLLAAIVAVSIILGYVAVDGAMVSWRPIAVAPVISFIACMMARRAVAADQELLASADRIR